MLNIETFFLHVHGLQFIIMSMTCL